MKTRSQINAKQVKKIETALAKHSHINAHSPLRKGQVLGNSSHHTPNTFEQTFVLDWSLWKPSLDSIPTQHIAKRFSLTAQEISNQLLLRSFLPSSTVICTVCEFVTDVKQASQHLSLAQRDLSITYCAWTPPAHARVDTQLPQGISLLPGTEMWRSTHCFCSASCFMDSKDDVDGEGKCLFFCKQVSASGQCTPDAARAMFLMPAQNIEELLDRVLLLKRMLWK